MKTVIETKKFEQKTSKIWSETERLDFIDWISENHNDGQVIPGADGARKIRWTTKGKGKRGGVRVIYLNIDDDFLLLIDVYKKSEQENWRP